MPTFSELFSIDLNSPNGLLKFILGAFLLSCAFAFPLSVLFVFGSSLIRSISKAIRDFKYRDY